MDSSQPDNPALEACLTWIADKLPGWEALLDRVAKLNPDWIAQHFAPESSIPTAAVCIIDCVQTLGAARYALDRYCEIGSERRAMGDNMGAVFLQKFYLDDVSLRLYSAAEHLANGVLFMLEKSTADLAQIRNVVSQWEKVRKFLSCDFSTHPLTKVFATLRKSASWRFTMKYRNRWVHNQPPTLEGLGLIFERRQRWQTAERGVHRLVIGLGDQPNHAVSEVAELFLNAFVEFVSVVEQIVDFYFLVIGESGVAETDRGLSNQFGSLTLNDVHAD